jgi:hypothetical protein
LGGDDRPETDLPGVEDLPPASRVVYQVVARSVRRGLEVFDIAHQTTEDGVSGRSAVGRGWHGRKMALADAVRGA